MQISPDHKPVMTVLHNWCAKNGVVIAVEGQDFVWRVRERISAHEFGDRVIATGRCPIADARYTTLVEPMTEVVGDRDWKDGERVYACSP